MNPSINVPRLTNINRTLLITCGAIFLINSITVLLGFSLNAYLGLSTAAVLQGHVYQLLTYPLVGRGLMELLFNGLVVWFIGCDLEARWGRKTYSWFLFWSVFGSGLFYLAMTAAFFRDSSLFAFPLVGLSGLCYGLLIAYGMIFSERMMTFMLLFPMKAKYFCWLLVGIELYMGIFSPYNKSSWAHLAAIVSGVTYLKWQSHKSQGGSFLSLFSGLRRHRAKGKLSLVDDAKKDNGSKYWH
ncbi:MAG: rhomboid family intramembrane serine protease [Bacteriovoracaceae bacterium]|nr:rhomboid family intramembrane serine protease [Bacteriovoracaceae bacterium]